MKLIGKLKKQVDATTDKAQAKELIAKAGMELTDEEIEQVAGGATTYYGSPRNDPCNPCEIPNFK